MKIYYSVSVRGSTVSKEMVVQQINTLKKYGDVLTEHLGSDDIQVVDMGLTNDKIYQTDMKLLSEADIVIADCTAASLGVGYIISRAEDLGKPVLCTYFCHPEKDFKLSAMIDGSPKCEKVKYFSIQEFNAHIRKFILKNNKKTKIFLCGPPGSGKSTVASMLSQKFGYVNISTGQILRDITKDTNNPMTNILNSYIHTGKLVPADIMTEIVIDRLSRKDCLLNGFVLDGYPPSHNDLQNLVDNNIHPSLVFYFECSDETAIKRQCCRNERVTDTYDKALERIKIYHEGIPEFNKLSSWYPKTVVIKVNAENDQENVCQVVMETTTNLLNGYYTNLTESYFPTFSNAPLNTTKFHFHIDAPNHKYLLDVLYDVYVHCPELQGQIKVYPIRNLDLGTQVKECDAYNSMINFHTISESNNEAFITGKLGDVFDLELFSRVLNAVKNRRNQNIKIMVELEEYTDEWVYDTTTNTNKNIIKHKNNPIDFSSLEQFNSHMIKNVPPGELHFAFDIPKNKSQTQPINLSKLNKTCQTFGLNNGGWFIFQNKNVWAYRSNEFIFDDEEEAVNKLTEQSHMLKYALRDIINYKGDIGCSLELVHGIWIF
ncbi:hypothetical protein QJ856_gp0215 [Tupanvirus deep ocean]|uniref:Uncharacterized protein n=2 Tax=Tupanvirus TaxID=2094720 RepID=A0AC62A9R7_9VIRU|nr:hypothetical protein QJ856_gp0215 [Tupanvirus deep ocean]QKU34514.1 hypothetical protein [Tupanvirus deep ocean]